MVPKKWRYLLFPILLLPLFFYPVPMLEVRTGEGDKVLLRKKVDAGDIMEFRYIHSVEKIPVIGRFMVTREGKLQLLETQFDSFGPGLPFLKEDVVMEGGRMKGRPAAQAMDRFSFLVSPSTGQTLRVRDATVDFSGLKHGETVAVVVKKYSAGRVLLTHGK